MQRANFAKSIIVGAHRGTVENHFSVDQWNDPKWWMRADNRNAIGPFIDSPLKRGRIEFASERTEKLFEVARLRGI